MARNRFNVKLSAVLFVILMLTVPQAARANGDFTIERAIDGETIQLSDGRRVRLIGVNATNVRPLLAERYQLTPDQISQLPLANLSAEATEYIQQHAVGKNIILSYDPAFERRGHEDSEGRVLAYVWYTTYSSSFEEGSALGVQAQDRLLNQEMIMMGHGLADTSVPFLQQEIFLEHEKSAANARRGFWRSASQMYQDLLQKAQGSQSASTAGFVGEEAREVSLKSARATYEKLIQMNPKDFRPYYERSWLGANPVHDQVSEENLKDIDRAIALSPFQPKVYMQRVFVLRLLERHDEALEVYERVVSTAAKFGLGSAVTDLAKAELEKSGWEDITADYEQRIRAMQAVRATINEDHFLFYMSRVKVFGEKMPEEERAIFEKVSNMGRFASFETKHQELLASASPHAILYQTQWGLHGMRAPEQVIKWMETVGEAPQSFEEAAKPASPAPAA
jgi:endonuclease YncB( thermonuclease family)